MLWARARVRHLANHELRTRLAEVRRQTPESETWLGLLEAALAESENGAPWAAADVEPAADRSVKAPALYRARISLDGRAAGRWVSRAAALATTLPRLRLGRGEALALLEAAVGQDDPRLDAIAAARGADPPALRVVAQLAALPLLLSLGARFRTPGPDAWWEGYCPVCGAWPALAEFRGLERKRWLRCGRCGGGWEIPWLRCPFCGETHHDHLGYLAPEGDEQTRRIEVCRTCQGYLKAVTTVRPLAPWAVPLEDAATLPLDVAALDRGYRRPERPGHPLEARVTERPRSLFGIRLTLRRRDP
ncbi:MAG TPA: formate dehydrogenase accessory protein FdhE [Gemmatimonadales bacterium]|nr:formate dehydrogenase accessory protein FdhE [Gemmatimonadales bacterium]